MGRDIWDGSQAGRAVFETADAVLGFKLSRLCFEGPEHVLRETENAQPAILAVSLACLAVALERGLVGQRPAFMAGHSLGEYTALVAAGALSLEDGLRLVRERGRLMAEAGRKNPGAMAAIVGLSEDVVSSICQRVGAEVCNLNLETQTVIGGTPAAVAAALELAKQEGARNSVELRVSGAFHTSLMLPAAEGLREAIAATRIAAPGVPVVANSTARVLSTAEEVREELTQQVACPVHWHRSVTLMSGAGVRKFFEFGPGRVLTGLVRRIVPGAALVNVSGLPATASAPSAT